MPDLGENIGDRIKIIFHGRHGFKKEIADLLNMSQANISRFFSGNQKLSIKQVGTIANKENIRAGWLAFGEEPQRPLTPEEIAISQNFS